MKSRRKTLEGLAHQRHTNAALWMDKYLRDQTEKGGGAEEEAKEAKARLLGELAASAVPDGYPAAYSLRRDDLKVLPSVVVGEAKATGRVVIGLGEQTPLEVGLHLEHTWGVPVLPGSALKGLAAATAHKLAEDDAWRRPSDVGAADGGESFRTLFGTTDESGAVRFHDAWWIPDGAQQLPIHVDVMTVHHPDYYQSSSGSPPPPSDMDSPNPISFASVTGRFLVAVEGPPEWCDAAMTLLAHGLRELGIGAKTNSGYGRMDLDWSSAEQQRLAREREEQEERDRQEGARVTAERRKELASLEVQPRWERVIAEADSDQVHEWLKELLGAPDGEAAAGAPVDAVASLGAADRRVVMALLVHDASNPHLSGWRSKKQLQRVEAARALAAPIELEAAPPAAEGHADLLAALRASEACARSGLTPLLEAVLADEESWPSRLRGHALPDDLSAEDATELLPLVQRVKDTASGASGLSKSGRKAFKSIEGALGRLTNRA